MSRTMVLAVAVTLLGGAPALAQINGPAPTAPRIAAAFTKDTQRFICPAGTVLLPPLIGEIAKNFDINPYALPSVPAAAAPVGWQDGQAVSAEARLAAWITGAANIGVGEAVRAGLTASQHETLTTIRWDLANHLLGLKDTGAAGPYRIAPGTRIDPIASGADRTAIVIRFFAALLHTRPASPLTVSCTQDAAASPPIAQREAQTDLNGPLPTASRLTPAVRGRINDLAAPRLQGDSISEAFKKASDATFAFTDNSLKGEQTVAIEAVIGLGYAVTPNDSLFGFVQYTQNSTRTKARDDDDDAKDVRALSPGVLWRRSAHFGPAWGTLGATIYPTFDFAQDSEMLRGRLFLSDIALDLGGSPVCDAERLIGPLLWKCRLGVSAEWAKVFDPGRSEDFKTLDDDRYFGLGGEAALTLSLPFIKPLKPFELNVEYRYLGILSGGLNDPARLTVGFTYKIPASNLSVGISRARGENFETFQREELTKFSVGFRY